MSARKIEEAKPMTGVGEEIDLLHSLSSPGPGFLNEVSHWSASTVQLSEPLTSHFLTLSSKFHVSEPSGPSEDPRLTRCWESATTKHLLGISNLKSDDTKLSAHGSRSHVPPSSPREQVQAKKEADVA